MVKRGYGRLRRRFSEALGILRSEILDLSRSDLADRLQARGHGITSRKVGSFERGSRTPTAGQTVEILRILGASFGDLERVMEEPSIRELRGPPPAEDAARHLGPSLKTLRNAEGFSARELVELVRETRQPMTIEKLERWERGELIPSILPFLWAFRLLGRSLGDLDAMLGDFSEEEGPEGTRG